MSPPKASPFSPRWRIMAPRACHRTGGDRSGAAFSRQFQGLWPRVELQPDGSHPNRLAPTRPPPRPVAAPGDGPSRAHPPVSGFSRLDQSSSRAAGVPPDVRRDRLPTPAFLRFGSLARADARETVRHASIDGIHEKRHDNLRRGNRAHTQLVAPANERSEPPAASSDMGLAAPRQEATAIGHRGRTLCKYGSAVNEMGVADGNRRPR
jgi:hypothetical protein